MPELYNVGPDRVGLQCGMLSVHADELIGHDVLSQVIALKVRRGADGTRVPLSAATLRQAPRVPSA